MKLIVESGATKTEWRSVDIDGALRSVSTAGINPSCMNDEGIRDLVRKAVPILNPEGKRVVSVFFYGAGLVSETSISPVRAALETWCPLSEINFYSDLLAAARALFGDGTGVAAIMGTGSNSCLYEEGSIVANFKAGGYILGDEGSGASLGKMFLSDLVKGLVPQDLEEDFASAYGLDYAGIVAKVYRGQAPSAFLASFAPFLLERMHIPYVRTLVTDCLESFLRRSLSRYRPGEKMQVGVVGSFGCACADLLREMGQEYGLEFVKFIKSPIDELVRYHGL